MKKLLKFLPLVCAACMLLAATGCKKIQKWDYPNENILIYVNNANGEDMLSAHTADNIFDDHNVSVLYDGQTLRCEWGTDDTRAAAPEMPKFNGLSYNYDNTKGRLVFGEFSIDTKDYRGEKFTINWGGGQSTDFEFDLWHTDNGDDQPTVHRAIRATGGAGAGASYDGALVITIVKPTI